jgi:peptidoglycan/xylan/chitin deacetylase (PgdA/CDA1 family)
MKLKNLWTIALAGSVMLWSCEGKKNNWVQEVSDDPSLQYEVVYSVNWDITWAITEVKYPSKYDNRDRFDENWNPINKNGKKQKIEKWKEDSLIIGENDSIQTDSLQDTLKIDSIIEEIKLEKEKENPRKNIWLIEENTKNEVFITIDDGPWIYTEEIAEELHKRGHRATFFLIWNNIKENRYEAMKKAEEMWHELWNHSFSHPNFRKISLDKAKEQLEKTKQGIIAAWVTPAQYFRYPYGASFSNEWLFDEYLKCMGYEKVFRTIDTRDWNKSTTKKDLIKCLEKVKPWDIILIHERSYTKDKTIPVMDSVLKSKNLISVPYRKK